MQLRNELGKRGGRIDQIFHLTERKSIASAHRVYLALNTMTLVNRLPSNASKLASQGYLSAAISLRIASSSIQSRIISRFLRARASIWFSTAIQTNCPEWAQGIDTERLTTLFETDTWREAADPVESLKDAAGRLQMRQLIHKREAIEALRPTQSPSSGTDLVEKMLSIPASHKFPALVVIALYASGSTQEGTNIVAHLVREGQLKGVVGLALLTYAASMAVEGGEGKAGEALGRLVDGLGVMLGRKVGRFTTPVTAATKKDEMDNLTEFLALSWAVSGLKRFLERSPATSDCDTVFEKCVSRCGYKMRTLLGTLVEGVGGTEGGRDTAKEFVRVYQRLFDKGKGY